MIDAVAWWFSTRVSLNVGVLSLCERQPGVSQMASKAIKNNGRNCQATRVFYLGQYYSVTYCTPVSIGVFFVCNYVCENDVSVRLE